MPTDIEIKYEQLKQLFKKNMLELKSIKTELDAIENELKHKRLRDQDDEKAREILATLKANESGANQPAS